VFEDNWRYHPASYDQEHDDDAQHRRNCTPTSPRF
jgi:hypothetical protein